MCTVFRKTMSTISDFNYLLKNIAFSQWDIDTQQDIKQQTNHRQQR